MDPSVRNPEVKCFVEANQKLCSGAHKPLAISRLLPRLFEDGTSDLFYQWKEVPCEWATDGSGCRRALKRAPDHWRSRCLRSSWRDLAGSSSHLVHCDRFENSRQLWTILQLSGFLEWALYRSWQPLLFRTRGPKTLGTLSRDDDDVDEIGT